MKGLDGFDSLADVISSYPAITRKTHFVLVPGPRDLTINSILPRKPLLTPFTSRLKSRVPKVHFATNPCRIKFCEQEIVIFREDLMARMLRNLVGVKPNVREDDLKRYVSLAYSHARDDRLKDVPAGAIHPRPKPPDTTDSFHSSNSLGIRPHASSVPVANRGQFISPSAGRISCQFRLF